MIDTLRHLSSLRKGFIIIAIVLMLQTVTLGLQGYILECVALCSVTIAVISGTVYLKAITEGLELYRVVQEHSKFSKGI